MLLDEGDSLPVSALPVDGTYPSGTTQYEKRNISDIIAVWDEAACIQCGNCAFVCPHSVLRAKYYDEAALEASGAKGAAAVYYNDLYVPVEYSMETAALMPAVKTYVTSIHEHSGLRSGDVLPHLFDLAAGRAVRRPTRCQVAP